jgi:GTP-binding protein Era
VAEHRCGFVAIAGRPNVGKSTLLNRLIGQKVSITSRKPQTTRQRILGIKTGVGCQAIYVDTPGLHEHGKRALNRYMNESARSALREADLILFVVEGLRWTEQDDHVLQIIKAVHVPVILVINKVDKIADKRKLLPHLDALAQKMTFAQIIPLSARSGDNLAALEERVRRLLPEGPPFYPEEQVTDRSERVLAAELIREQLMRSLGKELPYAATVEVGAFSREEKLLRIEAVIWVEREGQKAIVIGKGGARLKAIGRQARLKMEKLFDAKVFLQLHVRVKQGWSDNVKALAGLGYE